MPLNGPQRGSAKVNSICIISILIALDGPTKEEAPNSTDGSVTLSLLPPPLVLCIHSSPFRRPCLASVDGRIRSLFMTVVIEAIIDIVSICSGAPALPAANGQLAAQSQSESRHHYRRSCDLR